MNSLPGQRDGRTMSPRQCLLSYERVLYITGVIHSGKAYDGANTGYEDELRAGTPMGRVTTTKTWVPCKRTVVNGTAGAVTSVVVRDARAFKAGDVITIGGDTGITISAINYGTNTFTIASTTVADGDVVFAEDGSATCRAILGEYVKLKSLDDGVLRDRTTSRLIIAGFVDDTKILGDLTAIRADTNACLRGILWGDQQGAS